LPVDIVWHRFYQISFFFGYIVSATLYYIFNRISPPPGLGEQVDFDIDGSLIVEGVPSTDTEKETVNVPEKV
jgi:nucleobase:cation symporter-1, NCS1 family